MVSKETEQLWRRIGLEELRQAVEKTQQAINDFQRAVEALPDCEHCARVALLEKVGHSSAALERSVVGVNVLASVLQEAVAVAGQARQRLALKPPAACRCPGEPCQCEGTPDA